jgi:hypothetical protein
MHKYTSGRIHIRHISPFTSVKYVNCAAGLLLALTGTSTHMGASACLLCTDMAKASRVQAGFALRYFTILGGMFSSLRWVAHDIQKSKKESILGKMICSGVMRKHRIGGQSEMVHCMHA